MRVTVSKQEILLFHIGYWQDGHDQRIYPNNGYGNLYFGDSHFLRILKWLDDGNKSIVRHRHQRRYCREN